MSRPDSPRAQEAFRLALPNGKRTVLGRVDIRRFDERLLQDTARLERLRDECGCTAGALFLAVGVAGASVAALRHGASSVLGGTKVAALAFAAVVAITVAGKLGAIGVARLRWRVESANVLHRLLSAKGADDVH